MKLVDLDNSWGEGILQDWYIHSVNPDDEPQWTEAHIEELCKDFYVIPKEATKYDINYNPNRLKELIEADKEGRCVVLPCKVGDTVYKLWYRACHNGESCPDSYGCCGCEDECDLKRDVFEICVPSLEWILTNYEYLTHKNGNLFLTKEEAERTLEAEKNGKV